MNPMNPRYEHTLADFTGAWPIAQLTSKKSSTFAIDGHTGAVNGHFGSGGRALSSPEEGWSRMREAASL